ncbi:MAG TPA: 16S rRNA (cytidine(1402)-2'-O)-methyltransferase [Ruminiclostridium sp.]|nr:16S rRNA (cytidine(1402)-2'-O)-methyltransferase [Ruminiclostridium sp.]
MAGILYLVGTPIGNLGDFSERALKTLESADFIAAEDTRVTLKLLNHFNIKKPMISYFEHNKFKRGDDIAARIEAGETCALVTDAGMPAISDPGEDLVALCSERGIPVAVVPGPCAAVSALALSGLHTGRFAFEGFLDANKKSRRERLKAVQNDNRTLIFYEAPHKLRAALRDMFEILGDRRVALVREMTKIHEETFRTTLSQAVDYYSANEPRGEFVLIIEGSNSEVSEAEISEEITETGEQLVELYMNEGMSRPEAVKRAAKEKGISRSELYKRTANPNS